MNVCRCIICLLLPAVFLFPQAAVSEEKPLWEIGVGGGILHMPDYRGSDEGRFLFLPHPYLIYRGDVLNIDDRRISGKIFGTDRITLDASGSGSAPLKSSDNSARSGMPDLDATAELGPALKINILGNKSESYDLNLFLPVRVLFSTDFASVRREGWIFSPRINLEKRDIIPGTGLKLGLSAGPMFADSSYNAYFYTVEAAYARAGRPAYAAGGGYSGSTLRAGLSKTYKRFIFQAFISADFFQGAVFEDSPLVKAKTSVISGIDVSWIFFKSDRKVQADE